MPERDDVHARRLLGGDLLLDLGEQVRGEPPEPLGADGARAQSSSSARTSSGRQLAPVELLGRTGHRHLQVVVDGDLEVAARQVHRHGAGEAAQPHAGDGGRAGAGAAGEGLAHAALPDPHRQLRGALRRARTPRWCASGSGRPARWLGPERARPRRRAPGARSTACGLPIDTSASSTTRRSPRSASRPSPAGKRARPMLHLHAAVVEGADRARGRRRSGCARPPGSRPAGLEVARDDPDAVAAVLGLAAVRVPDRHPRRAAVVAAAPGSRRRRRRMRVAGCGARARP